MQKETTDCCKVWLEGCRCILKAVSSLVSLLPLLTHIWLLEDAAKCSSADRSNFGKSDRLCPEVLRSALQNSSE